MCCLHVLNLAAGFVCRWELLPNQPDVLLSVDYRGLLPDESITLELSPNNIIRLETPDGGPGAVFQASAWVDSSILVSFQSTRSSTDRGESSNVPCLCPLPQPEHSAAAGPMSLAVVKTHISNVFTSDSVYGCWHHADCLRRRLWCLLQWGPSASAGPVSQAATRAACWTARPW